MTNFVNLHTQTSFSILDSLIEPKELFEQAKRLQMSSVAVTDHGSLAAAWASFKASKATGVKLIIGCELYFQNNIGDPDEKFKHIILLAKNATGYRNLLTANKLGFDAGVPAGKKIYPVIDWKILKDYSDGLICLTACGNGILGSLIMNGRIAEAEESLLRLKDIFGENLGIEVQANNMDRMATFYSDKIDQRFLNRKLIEIGKKYDVKIVPTCNAHYLNKEDHEVHDVLLAIGSHQPMYSNFRTKYNVPDFYLKSGDEVKAFFARNYGDEFAEEICANSVVFADMCEFPDWIDPKHSNPSGKELPIFPVKDEKDYDEFKEWQKHLPDNLKKFEEDTLYLRYKSYNALERFFAEKNIENKQEYIDRVEEELDTLDYCGVSSYMLIVADYINWCKNNGVSVGPGRGCLTGETMVLSIDGFKPLDQIKINDYVYSHMGSLKKVLNTFKFDVSKESLIKIKSDFSFNNLIMTKDHKVYACKKIETAQFTRLSKIKSKSFLSGKIRKYEKPNKPEWIKASDLEVGDFICASFPKRNIEFNLPDSFELKYSSTKNSKLDKTSRLIVDDNFFYFLGRFVGDGWLHFSNEKNDSYRVGIAFNSSDVEGISHFMKYFSDLNLNPGKYDHKTKKLVQIIVHNKSLAYVMKDIFPDYKLTSGTKHLPIFFRQLNNSYLKCLINGIIDSDGFIKEKHASGNLSNRISIDSTSLRLILEIKEALLFLKTKSSIKIRKPHYSGKYLCNTAYKLRFKKEDFDKNHGDEYFSKITNISECNNDFVYDITVEDDHSYLTTNGIVHNSVGGCFVGFLLGIHEADSIKYGLVFPRFHNKIKLSYSDIDVDFSKNNRHKVLEYVSNKYGADNVAHVSNINTITPKVYVRDIARSCELGGDKDSAVKIGNDVAGCIPNDIHSIRDAFKNVPLFSEYCNQYQQFINYEKISNKPRAMSTHASGVVIGRRTLTGLIPSRKDKDGTFAVEYDKDTAEEVGLVKMDILGLNNLDIIDATYDLIKKSGKEIPKINFEDYDQATYDLISSGNTFGVFQFGTSAGTIELCKKIKPKCMEDLAIITTLARPASKDIREKFIQTREGKLPVQLLHKSLERAFDKTYGFPLYDESLLILAKDVAGWDLGDADKLRKLTKEKGKNPEKVKKWRSEFIEGSVKNSLSESDAIKIWEQVVEPYGKYSFNKSHAILYSIITYQTAYLKAHYPVEFLLANLMAEVNSNTPDAPSNIAKIKQELRALNVKILPPNINESAFVYKLIDNNMLLTGLDALKFVGDDAINDIIEKRPFTTFFDFMSRVDSKKVRANTIQALAAAGALDCFGIPRKLMYLYCSDFRKKLQVWLKKHNPAVESFEYPWTNEKEWSIPEIYALEQFYLGEGFICKPSVAYENFFRQNHYGVKHIKHATDKTKLSPINVIITDCFEFKVKKEGSKFYGMTMAKLKIEDKMGDQCSCTIFPDRWTMLQNKLSEISKKMKVEPGLAISFAGTCNLYDDDMGVIFEHLFDAAAPPSVPKDLKPKKTSAKLAQTQADNPDFSDAKSIMENIEDNLFYQGLVDLDDIDS